MKKSASGSSLNPSLLILSFIMLINALAYGTIIPLLYPYAARFGIGPFGLSLLFVSFSVAQFIATPIIGRLSDRYGRKPVLLICLLGTSASLALFAMATNLTLLFISRIIDGVTGGNISVAQAVIADTTKGSERAKAFGLLGAAFGFGFLVGPALGGIMTNIHLTAPFWFSAFLALLGTILGAFILKETLPPGKRQPSNKPLFNVTHLVEALFLPLTGIILLINFLTAISQNAFIIGVQSFTVDVLKMTPTQIGIMFASIGVINILMQVFGIRWILQKIPSKKNIVVLSLITSFVSMVGLGLASSMVPFMLVVMSYGVFLAPLVPVLTALLSERTKGEDQGGVMGINQAYTSLGQIVGPLLAGAVAARISIPSSFFLAAGFIATALLATKWLYHHPHEKLDL